MLKRLLIAAVLLLGFALPAAAQQLGNVQVGASAAVMTDRGNKKLVALSVTTGANAVSVAIIDSATAPSAGTITPKACFYVAATTTVGITYPVPPTFTNGISAVVSSAGCGTYTADTTAYVSVVWQ